MKRIAIMFIILFIFNINMNVISASNSLKSDKMESISQQDRDQIIKLFEEFRKSDHFQRMQDDVYTQWQQFRDNEKFTIKRDISISIDDVVVSYNIGSKYGESLNKNKDMQDLLKQSKKTFYCPVRINGICHGECYLSKNDKGTFEVSDFIIFFNEVNHFEILDNNDTLNILSKEVKKDNILKIDFLYGLDCTEKIIYIKTTEGEFVYPMYVTGVESKVYLKFDDFIQQRVQQENKFKQIANAPKASDRLRGGNTLVENDTNKDLFGIDRNVYIIILVAVGVLSGFIAIYFFVIKRHKDKSIIINK